MIHFIHGIIYIISIKYPSAKILSTLIWKVKEESEKADLKFNIQKTKIMACGPITSWQMDGETMETKFLYTDTIKCK